MKRIWIIILSAFLLSGCYKDEGSIPGITESTIIYPDVQPELVWSTEVHEGTEGPVLHLATVKKTHHDMIILFENWTTLMAINRNDGSVIWKTNIKDVIYALPIAPQNFSRHNMRVDGTVVIIGDELFYLSARAWSIPVFNIHTGQLIELRTIEGTIPNVESPGFPTVYKDGILYFTHIIHDFTNNNSDLYIYRHDLSANTTELSVAIDDRHLMYADMEIAIDFERSKAYFVAAVWKPLFPGNVSMHKVFEADLITGNYRIVWEEQRDGFANYFATVFLQYPYFLVDGYTFQGRSRSFNIETGEMLWHKEIYDKIKLINGDLYAMHQNTFALDIATGSTSLVANEVNSSNACFNSIYPYIVYIHPVLNYESSYSHYYCSIRDVRSSQRLISWRAADEPNPHYEGGGMSMLSFRGAPFFDQEAGLIYMAMF